MPNNSTAHVVRFLADQYDIKFNQKLGGFRFQL